MIKTIIFDMDGTILNTLDDITNSVNVSLESHNLPLKSTDEVRLAVGRGAMNLIKDIVPKNSSDELIKSVYDKYQAYYDKHSNDLTKPYEGIKDLLKTLKGKGYQLAVVSNKHEYLVEGLNKDVFDSIFNVAIGQTEGIPIKPAPDMLYKGLSLLNSRIEESVFIGDSDTDIKTAKNANIRSIGVTWGFRDEEVLVNEGAKYIVSKPFEILDIIERV